MLLSGKSLKREFIRFITATMASLMVFSLYSMVDGLMVAIGVNEYAMSAVNLSLPFTNALFSIAILFAVGSSTLIAIHLAQKRYHEADVLFSQNFVTLILLGVAATVLVMVFLEPFALLLGADSLTLGYVKEYLLGLAPFSVCFLISYNLEVLVKTDGYPRYALCTVITGCLTNCVLDYIAIFWLDMGVFGAAVATGISQMVTCILYLIHFFSKKCTFRLRRFRFDPRLYAAVFPIGFADGVTELCNGLMIFLFNRTVLHYIGTDGVVTYTVIAYVNTVIINLMIGISQGAQPLVSYHYGKGEYRQCNVLLRYGLTTVCILSPLIFAGLNLFAPQIVGGYLSQASAELVTYSIGAFRQYSFAYLIVGFNVVIGGFMTALKRPVPANCISIGRGLVLQSASLLTLAALFGSDGLWFTPIISEALCLCLSLFFLRRYQQQFSQ